MPSKIQLDENLWFLYICLQKSDYKTIDFIAVGEAANLKAPAARMRYTRLKKQIETGTLIGTRGTPFSGTTDRSKGTPAQRKRKAKTGDDYLSPSSIGQSADNQIKVEEDETAVGRKMRTRGKKIKIQQEDDETGTETARYGSGSSSAYEGLDGAADEDEDDTGSDSDEGVPLAKRRKPMTAKKEDASFKARVSTKPAHNSISESVSQQLQPDRGRRRRSHIIAEGSPISNELIAATQEASSSSRLHHPFNYATPAISSPLRGPPPPTPIFKPTSKTHRGIPNVDGAADDDAMPLPSLQPQHTPAASPAQNTEITDFVRRSPPMDRGIESTSAPMQRLPSPGLSNVVPGYRIVTDTILAARKRMGRGGQARQSQQVTMSQESQEDSNNELEWKGWVSTEKDDVRGGQWLN